MTIPDGVHHHVRTFHYSLQPSHTSVKNGSVAFVGSALSVTINSFFCKKRRIPSVIQNKFVILFLAHKTNNRLTRFFTHTKEQGREASATAGFGPCHHTSI